MNLELREKWLRPPFGFAKHVILRAGSHYGQTLRGEAFGPMKMQKCPKAVLSAFTLEAEVQRTSPPKSLGGNTFRKL